MSVAGTFAASRVWFTTSFGKVREIEFLTGEVPCEVGLVPAENPNVRNSHDLSPCRSGLGDVTEIPAQRRL